MAKLDRVHPLAIEEAIEARNWYASKSVDAPHRFDADLRDAFAAILSRPESFPGHLVKTKRCLLDRYPYAVVFRESSKGIFIVAVAHGSRKPGYWRKRLK